MSSEPSRQVTVAVFSAKPHDRTYLEAELKQWRSARPKDLPFVDLDLLFLEPRLTPTTAKLAAMPGVEALALFVNDDLGADAQKALLDAVSLVQGLRAPRIVVCRSAGFNNIDLHGPLFSDGNEGRATMVTRVPAYSPDGVAEFAVSILLASIRHVHHAYQRVQQFDFRLSGLEGFILRGKRVGVVGASGKIGSAFARIMSRGFGCEVVCYDTQESDYVKKELGLPYVPLDELYRTSHVVSLHVPLLESTRNMIDERALDLMQDGVVIVNISRGQLIDTPALLKALKRPGKIGAVALDVVTGEEALYFEDHASDAYIGDDEIARLCTFRNVLLTGHQAFFTREALSTIAHDTITSLGAFFNDEPVPKERIVWPAEK